MDVFSMKKVLLGGAAVTAAVLLVMSAAWACSPYGNRDVLQGGRQVDAGPPGTVLVITGTKYEAKYGEVTVQWTAGSDWGTPLAKPALKYTHSEMLKDLRTDEMVNHDFHEFRAEVTAPLDKDHGYIDVIQYSPLYGLRASKSLFDVQASQTGGGTTTTLPPTVTTLAPNVIPPFSPPTTRALAPGSQIGPAIGAPDVQRPAVLGAPDRTIEGGGVAAIDPGAPLAQAVAQIEVGPQLPPWIDQSEPDAQTLWSGLEKSDGSTGATLTVPTEPPDDPTRPGAALLTLGVLLLLTGGLGAVPRRRALARIQLGVQRKTSTW